MNPLELSIDNVPIEQVSSLNRLEYLLMKIYGGKHIYKLSKKIASGIEATKRIRPFIPPPTLHCLYNAFIQSHYDYCNLVWGNWQNAI